MVFLDLFVLAVSVYWVNRSIHNIIDELIFPKPFDYSCAINPSKDVDYTELHRSPCPNPPEAEIFTPVVFIEEGQNLKTSKRRKRRNIVVTEKQHPVSPEHQEIQVEEQ